MSIIKRNKIVIRQAVRNDLKDIMAFINKEWKNQHILARDESFFLYEHLNVEKINFIIALNEKNEILGLIGFIICAPGEITDLCTVIWKVAKPSGNPALGIRLLQYVSQLEKVRFIFSTGINKLTIPIYTFLGMYTDKLKHYYLLNPAKKNFTIANIVHQYKANNMSENNSFNISIKLIENVTELKKFPFHFFKNNIPYKNEYYFIKRYFNHPIYKYLIYGVYQFNKIVALIVLRKQYFNGSNVIRFIDYYGEDKYLAELRIFFNDLLIENDAEYVDFYCYGFNNKELEKCGFKMLSNEDENIIPNFFSPFVQENISISFFTNSKNLDFIRLCKGDGDQDRPN